MSIDRTEEDIFSSLPLYQSVRMDSEYGPALIRLLYNEGNFDSYCPFCKERSTFYYECATERLKYESVERSHAGVKRLLRSSNSNFKPATCGRDPAHTIECYYRITYPTKQEIAEYAGDSSFDTNNLRRFEKVGQTPSQFDFAEAELKKYAKLLETVDLENLRKAIISSTHGYGASAFLYSRRVFERLIESKRSEAEGAGTKIESTARMDEKVKGLAEFLPDFLVENSHIYAILGKGVHELTDEECVALFPVIRESVIAILEDDREAKEREMRKSKLKKDIAGISSLLGKKNEEGN